MSQATFRFPRVHSQEQVRVTSDSGGSTVVARLRADLNGQLPNYVAADGVTTLYLQSEAGTATVTGDALGDGAESSGGGGGGASAASAVTFAPVGGISSTTVQAALGELDTEKAPLASPALSGTPTAPTAAQGTNTTQIATTAFARAEIAALVASAPGTLDTLGEIAAALQADESTAVALATTVGGKQPLDADLTTIAALDSTTAGALVTDGSGWIRKTYAQLKTALSLVKGDVGLGNVDNTSDASKPVSTAQQAALDLKAPLRTVRAKTAAYTALDRDIILANTSGGVFTITLPAVASGLLVTVKKTDSSGNALTVAPASGTIDGAASLLIATQYMSRDLVCDGTNWWQV